MTIDEMEAELARWTFMPGYRFELVRNRPARVLDADGRPWSLFADDREYVVLRIRSRVPNTYNPDEIIEVQANSPVPVEMIQRGHLTFGEWLRHVVHERMIHEADEWLKRDGVMVYDPHAREARR